MTIITTQARITYAGDNVSTLFPIPFEFFLPSDITAVKTAVGGGVAILALNVDYTLSGAGTPGGGSATKTTPLLTGETLAFFLNPPIVQGSHYISNGPFPASTLENDVDRQTQISQRLQDQVSRAIRAPDADPAFATAGFLLPSYIARANTFLTFDANGNPTIATALVPGTVLSAATVGAVIGPQTAAEAAAGVTIVSPWLPVGNMLRYGIVPNSSAAATNNSAIMNALFSPSTTGPVGYFVFPNTTGTDTYSFNATCPIRPGVHIDLNGCTIAFIGSCTANDVNVGLFYPLSDFILENGTITLAVNTTLGVNAGSAVFIGARGAGFYYTVFESTFTGPTLGRIWLRKLTVINNNTGGNSGHCIAGVGGFSNVFMDDITINCNNVMGGGGAAPVLGIYLEYGYWSTGTGPPGTLVTSHAKNMKFTNLRILNSGNAGLGLTGCYNSIVDGLYTNQCVQNFVYSVGQAMFYNVSPNDTAGQKRSMTLRNLVGQACTGLGIQLTGSNTQGGFTAQQQTDLMTFDIDGVAIQATGASSGGMSVSGNVTASNVYLDLQGGGGLNPLLISPDCMYARFENSRFLGGAGAGVRADITSTYWSPSRLRFMEFDGCQIAGNLIGLSVLNTAACKITNCRIGYNALFDGVGNEATQTTGVSVASGGQNVICDSNYVTVAGGGNAYSIIGTTSSGCNIVNPLGTLTSVGAWEVDGMAKATNVQILDQHALINTASKRFGRRVWNTNGYEMMAQGPNPTDTWQICGFGTSTLILTPV